MAQKAKKLSDYKFKEKYSKDRRRWTAEYKAKQLAKTTLEQRQIFIEELRANGEWNFEGAMKKAGIEDHSAAYAAYQKNSRPLKTRVLVEEGKVK
jgi:uncharacterized membrane protein YkoI